MTSARPGCPPNGPQSNPQGEGRDPGAELDRLMSEDGTGGAWRDWGPWLAERAWGTVRKDYSAAGDAWTALSCCYPYEDLRAENARRGKEEPQYKLADTGGLDERWEVTADYAKASPEDILIRVRVRHVGSATRTLHVLLFQGGFLGLDNIGPFDRSHQPPGIGRLDQSDATAWTAMFCLDLAAIAIELATADPVYEDLAVSFIEHFTYVVTALETPGLWDEEDGFCYDVLRRPDDSSRQPQPRMLSVTAHQAGSFS